MKLFGPLVGKGRGGGGGGEVVEEPGDRARHSWVLGELIISIVQCIP